METQHKLALVKNNTTIHVEIIDNQNMSLKPIIDEIEAFKVTIGLHTSKFVFNVISCQKNSIIIELPWLPFHNSQVDWHTRSFHFETLKHKALEYEVLNMSMFNKTHVDVHCALKDKHEDGCAMQILKHKDNFNGIKKSTCSKSMFIRAKAFMDVTIIIIIIMMMMMIYVVFKLYVRSH